MNEVARLLAFGVPVGLLLAGAGVIFRGGRTVWSWLQLLGTACLAIVIATHAAETFQLLRWMNWGSPHSAGHYLDLSSAVLGLTLFPIGYLGQAISAGRHPKARQKV